MIIAGFLSIILYFISLSLALHDPRHTSRYFILSLYLISVAIVFITYLKSKLTKDNIHKSLQPKEVLAFALVIVVIECISYFSLTTYPFVSVGDGVRDSGLDALRIATGKFTNFFTYGNYNGYGRLLPIFSSFFYSLFGSSVLTFRIPGAIIATLDVMLLYLLLRQMTEKKIAIIGALILALFPLHMYYARIELVVLFDSFWTTLLLLLFYLWSKHKSPIDFVMLGSAIGMAANFHTAVRVVAILLLLVVIITTIRKHLTYVLVFLVFFMVGFGPLILSSNTTNFLQQKRYVQTTPIKLEQKYVKSLLVWVHEGTTSRYPPHTPILSLPLFILFLLGAGYALYLRNLFSITLVLLIFILPFTNSAMTDWVNADHRLLPYLPIAAVLITLGIHLITYQTKHRLINNLFFGLFLLLLVSFPYHFFTDFTANDDKTIKDYLSMHIINLVKSHPEPKMLCIFVSPTNRKNLDLLHYKEQYWYFLPKSTVTVKENKQIPDNEAYLFNRACPKDYKQALLKYSVSCTIRKVNYCPANYIGAITIFTNE